MAPKKKQKPMDVPPPPPPVEVEAEGPTRRNIISIRGTDTWRDWLARYATSRRVSSTVLIDLALTDMAKRDGFEPPPER